MCSDAVKGVLIFFAGLGAAEQVVNTLCSCYVNVSRPADTEQH